MRDAQAGRHAVASAVIAAEDALSTFTEVGGQLPTTREEQRKFPEDFPAIKNDLEILHQGIINDENPWVTWNQLRTTGAIATPSPR
jgi:hypothetical protein